jgi:ribonuclease HII
MSEFTVGIDEAGRGPLAGPVAVGAVKVGANFSKKFWKGIKDSKKLSPEERDLWFTLVIEAKRRGDLDFAVSLVSEKVIDRRGITYAIGLGIKRCLDKLNVPAHTQIFLDGSLKAPQTFVHQRTIIKGDEKIPIISCASICAKVMRDRYMTRLSKKYPLYGFHIHKGYGTLVHRRAIKKYGLVEPHRRSFTRSLTKRQSL